MAAELTRLTHVIAIQLHLSLAVLAPGGQSGNFWIPSYLCVSVVIRSLIISERDVRGPSASSSQLDSSLKNWQIDMGLRGPIQLCWN